MTLADCLHPYRHHLFLYQREVWTYEALANHCQASMKAQAVTDGDAVWWLRADGSRSHVGPVIIMARTARGGHRHHELRTAVAPESVVERLVDQARRLWRRSLQSEERR